MVPQNKKKRVDDQPLPPDAGQRPIQLQRRRVWRACESCRRKKIKCDGTEPTCSQCAATGTQCTWLQTKDRAALSRHYVQELEARLLHMESLFSQIAPVLNQLGQNAPELSLPQSSSSATPEQTVAVAASIIQSLREKDKANPRPSDNRSTPDSSVKIEDDVVDSLGQLALDEHGHMRWIGGSSSMSLINSFKAATAAPRYRVSPVVDDTNAPNKLYFPSSVFFGKTGGLPGPEEVEYPPRDLADALIGAYFLRFHFLCPIIDKPMFMRQYQVIMDHTGDINLSRSETAFIALVFAVFACAAPLLDDPRLKGDKDDDGGMGMVYYERSLILSYISHASTQVAHVQCFVLLSSFLCSVNCLPQAWILTGQGLRIAQDLGMHRSPRRLNISAIEKETRRKIWWGVYTLDRMLALALGRPIGAEDADCDVELPVAIDDEQLASYFDGAPMQSEHPALMAGFAALCSLYGIAGRVMRQVYGVDNLDISEADRRAQLHKDVELLDAELTKWLEELPPVFKSNMMNEQQVSMGAILCSHYYSVLTALHRNLLPVANEQPVAPRSAAKALSAARACIRLAPFVRNVVGPSHHLAFFIQHLFSCAVIVLLYAMHVTDEHAATAALGEAQGCLAALESWEGLWPGARKCKELLTELTTTAREAVMNQQNDQPHSQPPQHQAIAGPSSASFSSSMAGRERRHSFSSGGKAIRNKLNLHRNLSPDSRSRPTHHAAALRYDSQRARSASRKRGYDDPEDSLAYRIQALQRGGATQTALSSPTSAGSFNSPRMSLGDPLPPVNAPIDTHNLAPPHFNSSLGGPSPISPGVSSPYTFDFDFAHGQTQGAFGAGEQWVYDDGSKGLTFGSGNSVLFEHPFEQPATIDPAALYGGSGGGGGDASGTGGLYGLSGVAPSATFTTPGLPFLGFDYIRNFDGAGNGGPDDVLGQGFDAGAFRIEPEMAFSLGDFGIENGEMDH
ncbi:fungal-specific transcription factor domain-containing protein [Vararia minispora EC-137]|uniref:Fungal-specific transcription factor domain-containing protein n=1 Tax=Vararia minispora EC-137 TaxID=1314806 RepID=A0ACB8Q8I2_9AGAM|nr:fungal-specific transcription factor domain-containing protein [Vararia minispora EC-137]